MQSALLCSVSAERYNIIIMVIIATPIIVYRYIPTTVPIYTYAGHVQTPVPHQKSGVSR